MDRTRVSGPLDFHIAQHLEWLLSKYQFMIAKVFFHSWRGLLLTKKNFTSLKTKTNGV